MIKLLDILQEIKIDTSCYYKLHNLKVGDKIISNYIWNGERRTVEGIISRIWDNSHEGESSQINVSWDPRPGDIPQLPTIKIFIIPSEDLLNKPDFKQIQGVKFLQGLKVIK